MGYLTKTIGSEVNGIKNRVQTFKVSDHFYSLCCYPNSKPIIVRRYSKLFLAFKSRLSLKYGNHKHWVDEMLGNNAKKILSIQNIACETLGTLENLLLSEGYALHKVQALRDSIPKSANEFSAIIILGGPMSVYEGLSYLGEEQDLIRDAVQREIPTLGICLGSQLIAGALGGTVYKGREKEIGWYDVHITNEGFNSLFRGFEQERLEVFQWHGDTYALPVNAEILAFSTLYPQAFRFGSAYGLQFHLEVTSDMILSWMDEYKEETNKEGLGSESIVPNNHNNKINELVGKCKLVWNNFSDVISKSKTSSQHAGSS